MGEVGGAGAVGWIRREGDQPVEKRRGEKAGWEDKGPRGGVGGGSVGRVGLAQREGAAECERGREQREDRGGEGGGRLGESGTERDRSGSGKEGVGWQWDGSGKDRRERKWEWHGSGKVMREWDGER